MAGFEWARDLSGADRPQEMDIICADSTIAVGDLVNLESGQADLAASNDADLFGVVLGPTEVDQDLTSMTGGTTKIRVAVLTPTTVLRVADANARTIGDTLDITGASGAQGLADSNDVDVLVVETSTATQDTLVKIADGETWMD